MITLFQDFHPPEKWERRKKGEGREGMLELPVGGSACTMGIDPQTRVHAYVQGVCTCKQIGNVYGEILLYVIVIHFEMEMLKVFESCFLNDKCKSSISTSRAGRGTLGHPVTPGGI